MIECKKLIFYSYSYTLVIYFKVEKSLWLQKAVACNYIYVTCTSVPTFHTTYICSYTYIQMQLDTSWKIK